MADIYSLTNSLLDSKTYIIPANQNCVVIIDFGDPDISALINLLSLNGQKEIKVLLTHEHADHCAGLIPLYKIQPFELICTKTVSNNISDQKLNLSKYLEHIKPFEVRIPATIISDTESIDICNNSFTFIETPGHSPGSCCIFFNNNIFTGDTILNDTKTPLYLPNSDKNLYSQSILKLRNLILSGMTIYPGHGEPFIWK
ncbi:MAG: MBL fold metallo-hydrolase [Bacteroidales bacterium]|nr:MBL fold metallo-hydrolase [Bacteroidales bacterium]MCF8390286.1 MBL fold metallo-hydrolase [Bacteroidales bacterium]